MTQAEEVMEALHSIDVGDRVTLLPVGNSPLLRGTVMAISSGGGMEYTGSTRAYFVIDVDGEQGKYHRWPEHVVYVPD